MGLGHGHRHGHGTADATATGAYRGRLAVVFAVTAAVLVTQVVGAVLTGSLALVADAGHMATDTLGIGMALAAATLAQRAPNARRTFGWQRIEILAAGGNGLLLLAVAGYVLWEAVHRFAEPPPVQATLMLLVGVVGLVANAACLALLHRGRRESLNVRGAYLEVLGDLLGSAAVVVAAVVIATTGWHRADVVASAAVGVFILPRAWSLLAEAAHVLLEGTPKGVDLDGVRRHIGEVDGVVGVHDLHVWTITSGSPVLSAHVVVDDGTLEDGHSCRVLDDLRVRLAAHFDVEHSTFQLESPAHHAHEPALHD